MPAIRIPGVPDPVVTRPLLAETVEGVKPRDNVRVEAGRGETGLAELNGEFVEIELTGGVHIWSYADTIGADLGAGPARDGGPVVLPARLALGRGGTRGGRELDVAIQAVRTFEIDIPGVVADAATGVVTDAVTDFIKSRVENGRKPGGELVQCVKPSAAAFQPVKSVAGKGPTLVFLHGTASSTDGSFGGLWDAVGANRILRIENPGARVNDLFDFYEGRILAFEHRSLSESPIVNAKALVEQLAKVVPDGSELHLVSHSRGGLIGELLCRGMRVDGVPFDATDFALFEGDNRETDRTAMQELGRLLASQRYRIARFVRVACPAAGTTLADGRLDRYASMLTNVLGKVSGLAANPAYQMLTNLVAAILKERTKPESLPGLEAMMPISPLAQMVNRGDALTTADLHVLGGDLAVEGVWSALKALATQWYYRQDHDLVVNTPSMLLGAPRTQTVKYWLDEGGEVSHFNYFRRSDTAARLSDILQKGTADGLRDLKAGADAVNAGAYQKRDASAQPVVVLVPGFMGSHLWLSEGRVWADRARLARGGFASLDPDGALSAKVRASGVVGLYSDLVKHLSASHRVEPFAYDWRLDAETNGEALRGFIEEQLKKAKDGPARPLRVLTHGAGGIVFEAMLASEKGRALWSRVCEQAGARAVVLGYPFGGTLHALLPLLDRGPLLDGLDVVDLVSDRQVLRETLSRCDGLLELLPAVNDATWTAAEDATVPDRTRLDAAIKRRADVAQKAVFDSERIVLVAGTADQTPVGVSAADGETALEVTRDGDGYAAWETIPERLRPAVRVAPVDHGGLVTSDKIRPAIVELLTTGRTMRFDALSSREAARGKALGKRPTVPLHDLQQIPSDADLVFSGLGIGQPIEEGPRQRVRVSVVHGNLSRAKSPVVVGHYANDDFVSAEAYLDGQLHGRLRRRHQMRHYPEAIGTSAIEIQPSGLPASVHPGAIVVGLGEVGTLTPGALLKTLQDGLVAYGAERVSERLRREQEAEDAEDDENEDKEQESAEAAAALKPARRGKGARRTKAAATADPEAAARDAAGQIAAPVTALLVGSGEAGITLRDSLHALLRAVHRANERLDAPAVASRGLELPVPYTARIDRLDIFELYEDRAVEAMRTLAALMRDTEIGDAFEMEPLLHSGEDGQQRVSFAERDAWWQRLKVTEQDASIDPDVKTNRRVLKFEAFTERARIDAYAVNSLRQQADIFINHAIGTTAATRNVGQSIGQALFEILVPNELKERAPDRRDTVMLLDVRSAAIPWELFEDGLPTDRRPRAPLAIEAGLVRQLVDEHGRKQVRQAIGNAALVVGDPVVSDKRFGPLPGAADEAAAVAQLLKPLYPDTKDLIGPSATPDAVLAALHERPWCILHLAMHGVLDFPMFDGKDEPKVTGAVAGTNTYLTVDDFNQMRYVPSLVFLNCCHVGNTAADAARPPTRHPELAANLATQFIRMGARAVIAAGWAVDDGAALVFAQRFYTEMLDGRTFGEATLTARREIHRGFPQANTWGAYQCYGDPAFRLRNDAGASEPSTLYEVREAVLAANRLAGQARIADEAGANDVRTQLDALVGRTIQPWLADASLCAALAAAYGELRDFERAIGYYDAGSRAEQATLPVKALEQLANLKTRYAEHMWRDAKTKTGKIKKAVDDQLTQAEALLTALKAFGDSSERFSLMGGVKKRFAMTRGDKEEIALALGEMETAYRAAADIKAKAKARNRFYPLLNAVVARLTRSWFDPSAAEVQPELSLPSLAEEISELQDEAKAHGGENDFWSACFAADAALVAALETQDAARIDRGIVAKYRRAGRRGRSRRAMDSVITQIRFLATMAQESPHKDVRKLRPALEDLARQLTEG